MAKRTTTEGPSLPTKKSNKFHLDCLNSSQQMARMSYDKHDVTFLLGAPGTGKTHLAMAFAVWDILRPGSTKKKIILTRPIIEAGESLGFLPGELHEKVDPYMRPLEDVLRRMVSHEEQLSKIKAAIEVAPIAYMRGRAIVNSENIITPCGLKPMGEIKVGDQVIGSDGKPTRVLEVFPQGKVPVFEVRFSDGTKSICCKNHLWSTMTLNEKRHGRGFSAKTTEEIIETVKNKHGQKIHRMPILSSPVEFESQEISIDPYLLGILLGDGCFTHPSISITSSDVQIIDECVSVLPEGNILAYRGNYDYRVCSNRKSNRLKAMLEELGLHGLKSHQKFVPDNYKFNDVRCRISILQGLLDSDGWICKHRSGNCRIQFCSTSHKLAKDVMFLVRSLGGMAYSRKREFTEKDYHEHNGHVIRHTKPVWVVDIMINVNPFRLDSKANQYEDNQVMTKMISSVVPAGESEATCIKVEAEDSLFLTNDFIVTHNTFNDSVCIFDEAQNATKKQLKLFLTRFGENSKIVITGDPKQSDLPGNDVPLVDVVNRLETLNGIGIVRFSKEVIVRHPLVGAILEKLEE